MTVAVAKTVVERGVLLCLLGLMLLGCGTFRVEGIVLEPADATATAAAEANARATRATQVALIPTPTPQPGAISGTVWYDECTVGGWEEGGTPTPSEGCVSTEGAWYRANGIFESEEPGLERVVVSLGRGPYPAEEFLATRTDYFGTFSFKGLQPGPYCVFVDALSDANYPILVPGQWTTPIRGEQPGQMTVEVTAGQETGDLRFGWDPQFLPLTGPLELPPPADEATITGTIRDVVGYQGAVATFRFTPLTPPEGVDTLHIPLTLYPQYRDGEKVGAYDLARCATVTVRGARAGSALRAEQVTIEPPGEMALEARPRLALTDPVTLQANPDAASPVVTTLPAGTELAVNGRCEGWLAVAAPGIDSGWVAAESLGLATEQQEALPVLPAGSEIATVIVSSTVESVTDNRLAIQPVEGVAEVALQRDTQIFKPDGRRAGPEYLRPRMQIEVEGRVSEQATDVVEALRIVVRDEVVAEKLTAPIASAAQISFGGWSPDGRYVTYSEYSAEQLAENGQFPAGDFYFFDSYTGERCQFLDDYRSLSSFEARFLWLPGSQFLYISDEGEVLLRTAPCGGETFDYTEHFPDTSVAIAAQSADGTRLLVQGENGYWLYDIEGLPERAPAGVPVEGLSAEPLAASWSPGGSYVALSGYEGGTYILDTRAAAVVDFIEWRTRETLGGPGAPTWLNHEQFLISDTRDQGPLLGTVGGGVVQVAPEIFGEEVLVGCERSVCTHRIALGSVASGTGAAHIALLATGNPVNYPPVLLYHVESGETEELDFAQLTLPPGFSPDGHWLALQQEELMNGFTRFESWVREVDPAGREAQRVVTLQYSDPRWSPDWSRVAVRAEKGITILASPEGTVLQEWELEGTGIGNPAFGAYPQGWSPDGTHLAIHSTSPNSPQNELFIVPAR